MNWDPTDAENALNKIINHSYNEGYKTSRPLVNYMLIKIIFKGLEKSIYLMPMALFVMQFADVTQCEETFINDLEEFLSDKNVLHHMNDDEYFAMLAREFMHLKGI